MSLTTVATARIARFDLRLPQGLMTFLAVGVGGLAMHTGLFTALFHLGVGSTGAWFAGLVAGTLLTWTLNRRLTFAATGRRHSAEMARYAAVTLVSQGASFVTFRAGCALLPLIHPTFNLICGAALGAFFSYAGQRFFTFAPVKPSI